MCSSDLTDVSCTVKVDLSFQAPFPWLIVIGVVVVIVVVAVAVFAFLWMRKKKADIEEQEAQRKRAEAPAEIVRIARDRFGMVKPGEQPWAVVPGASTTTTTAPGAAVPGR